MDDYGNKLRDFGFSFRQEDRYVGEGHFRVWKSYRHHSDANRAISDLSPHYSESNFRKYGDHLVYGSIEGADSWDYSDRLYQWGYEKYREAWAIASKSDTAKDSAARIEVFLSEYFGKPIVLVGLVTGVNRGNGYPYRVYGYKDAQS